MPPWALMDPGTLVLSKIFQATACSSKLFAAHQLVPSLNSTSAVWVSIAVPSSDTPGMVSVFNFAMGTPMQSLFTTIDRVHYSKIIRMFLSLGSRLAIFQFKRSDLVDIETSYTGYFSKG